MHQAQLSHQLLSLKQSLARGSVEVWVSAKSVGPVACTKPGRQVTPTPPAQHIAGNAGQAAHVRYSPEVEKAAGRQATVQPSTGHSAAQPSPKAPKLVRG